MKPLCRALGILLATQLAACTFMRPSRPAHADAAEARSTAAEALLYGYPMVRSYGILCAHAGDPTNPKTQTSWNEVRHQTTLATPDDPGPATPTLDTMTSWLGLDLRSQPLVLTLPALEKTRIYWVQLIDLLKNTPSWMSNRTNGNGGGAYLLTRPTWNGDKPSGIRAIVRMDTDLALAVFRIQVFNSEDLETVRGIQSGISIQTLSSYLKKPSPPEPPLAPLVPPLSPDEEPPSLRFFSVLAFALQFCPSPMTERRLRTRFSRIGLEAGKPFDPQTLASDVRTALEEGIADGWASYREQKKLAAAKGIPIEELPSTPETPRSPYMSRFAASFADPLEESKEVATLPLAPYDRDGLPLDGSAYRYVLHFEPDRLPPAAAFWSLTLYDQPSGLLIHNPIGRYVLQSTMPGLRWDSDGGVTIRVQAESPGPDQESNWLPASRGRFLLILRLYDPKPESAKNRWALPYLEKAR